MSSRSFPTFLIPILTPSYFTSNECRQELTVFLARQERLGRDDLILPIYYVNCPQESVTPPDPRTDELAMAVFRHNYADWRELRYEQFSLPAKRRALTKLAVDVRDAIRRPGAVAPDTRAAQIGQQFDDR